MRVFHGRPSPETQFFSWFGWVPAGPGIGFTYGIIRIIVAAPREDKIKFRIHNSGIEL